MIKRLLLLLLFLSAILLDAGRVSAQFAEPQFQKIGKDKWAWFMKKFDDVKWTGRGMNRKTPIDSTKTIKLRSHLQQAFGSPTKTIEDLINTDGFRPGEAIQFEYWFTVDDSIPMMVLDIDGPFGKGLVYGGASRYIDLMPQIKRTFSQKLLSAKPTDFQDYFYSPEREQWFDVTYKNGKYKKEKIKAPKGMVISYDY